MTLLLSLLFVLSGAAGLIYESIWSRYLGLLVGHSADAQVIVLVIFLGGMSAGAALVARHTARIREPLLWYAGIEVVVGILGLLFHDLFGAASGFAYGTLFPALAGGPFLAPGKWALAALLILPQSVLLGATFPLMSAGVIRRAPASVGSGRVLGLLYFANSLGAAVGVLIAGFYLVRLAGLPGTLITAAILNLVVGLGAYLVARIGSDGEGTDASPPVAGAPVRDPFARMLLAVSFGTAVASFIYEIAWIRMLSLVLGSATHAFELMLSAFILGLALGAFSIRARADRVRDPVRLLGVVQFAMGALAIATLGVYVNAFDWMATLIQAVDENEAGYRVYNVARYGIALAVMLPPTFCAGITLPLITRTLIGAGQGERAIGAVYAWNTLGSILGVALAALVLMPMIGLRAMLIVGGGIDLALGVWLLWRRGDVAGFAASPRRTASLAAVAALAVVLGAVVSPSFDPGILSSGVFRYGSVPERGSRNIVFYEDGRTASVSVRLGSDSAYSLATNGKPDASLSRLWFVPPAPVGERPLPSGDESTQILLALVTLAHAPAAREGAVIGHGSGISSHMLLGSETLQRLVTIDIEREMVEASRTFRPANERAYSDPRSRFVYDDAKSYFAAAGRKFDLILSEPSNPWVSGVSGLFTSEFYGRVSGYLTPQGIFGQWLHLYEIDDDLVLSVLDALDQNFRSYAVFLTNDVDVLVVASNAERLPSPDWSVFRRGAVVEDLSRFAAITDDALERTLLMTREELAPLLATYRGANSDFYPHLDNGAERARFLRRGAEGFQGLSTDRFDVAAALGGRVVPLTVDRWPSLLHDRVTKQGLAARLRRGETLPPDDTAAANRDFQAARLRAQALEQSMATGVAPADWFVWYTQMIAAEGDWHGGTMGVIDSAWYARVERFMTAEGAPADARAAIRFLRSAMSYDWPAATREVDVLVEARNAGRQWLPPGMLLDATVVAKLRAGDIAGARATVMRLLDTASRREGDLRSQLLMAHVVRAEGGSGNPVLPEQ